ncbi:hypothetical protein D3C78_282060 [compost metagenome]
MHLLSGGVQAYARVLDEHLGPPGTAPEQGAQAGLELVEVERLDQVIVGAGIQASDAVFGCIARGKDQNRQAVAPRPHPAQQLDATQPRQPEVEDHQVECFVLQGMQPAQAIAQPVEGIALLAQPVADPLTQSGIILNQQQPHVQSCLSLMALSKASISPRRPWSASSRPGRGGAWRAFSSAAAACA